MIKEAIILAGGLGTRLREAVPDLPKCMAPILAKPFIGYLVDYLVQQGIEKFIFCLGYKHEIVEQYLNTQYSHLDIIYSVEDEPLGTGGAILLACGLIAGETALVLNGDTFFRVDIIQLAAFHELCGADCTLALKPLQHFDRYGVVQLQPDYSVFAFQEKKYYDAGLINGGVYALNVPLFRRLPFPRTFSFEKDYLEKNAGSGRLYSVVQDVYFIDIGIPADYDRAQTELIQNISMNA